MAAMSSERDVDGRVGEGGSAEPKRRIKGDGGALGVRDPEGFDAGAFRRPAEAGEEIALGDDADRAAVVEHVGELVGLLTMKLIGTAMAPRRLRRNRRRRTRERCGGRSPRGRLWRCRRGAGPRRFLGLRGASRERRSRARRRRSAALRRLLGAERSRRALRVDIIGCPIFGGGRGCRGRRRPGGSSRARTGRS